MTSPYLSTEFAELSKSNVDDGFIIVKKAKDDEVFELIEYKYDKPFKTSYTIRSVRYVSAAKVHELGLWQ